MWNILDMKQFAKGLNNLTFTDYYYRLMLLSRSAFEWTGLPNGIDEKWIERFLFYNGKCMFFKDKNLGFMVAKCTPSSNLNYYDEPTMLVPVATNYTNNQALENGVDCVLIRNNDDMIPTLHTIQLYAYRLAELTRTIDINIEAQKTPVLITGSDKQMKSLKTVYDQWNGNKPVIFGDKTLDVENIQVLKTDAPLVFRDLQLQKHALWNEVMTYLGINNANQDKKERLVDDEVQANNEQVIACGNIMLKARKRACEQINEIFGTNIDVKLRYSDRVLEEEIIDDGNDKDGDVAC